MSNRFIIFSCLFACTVSVFWGCGGEQLPPGMPRLYPATLTVTQDGKPLEGASIILTNVDPSVSWSAGGATDQNGVLRLRTMGRYDGVPAGTYRVAVSKIESPNLTLPDEMPSDPEGVREYNRILREIENNTFYVVDPKFSLGNSELEVEISPSNLRVTVDVSPAVHIRLPPPSRG